MRINRKRLEESMEALGRIGATAKGGLNRVALTDDDRRGRDLLVEWMRQAGLAVTVDPDHVRAREGLGYKKYNDKWMTAREIERAKAEGH